MEEYSVCNEQHQEASPVGSERYRVEKTISGFWPYCIKAGDGERSLYLGYKKTCDRVAAELACAFEDGKFVTKSSSQEHQVLVRTSERMPTEEDSDPWGNVAWYDDLRDFWKIESYKLDPNHDEFYASHWQPTGLRKPPEPSKQ